MLCLVIFVLQTVANFYEEHIKRKNYDYANLPPHIIAKILSRLPNDDFRHASASCKSWYYASCDPCVTKNIWVSFGLVSTNCDFLVRPIRNARFDMVNFNELNYRKILRKFGAGITNLEIFSKITCTQLFELFIYLPNLRSVTIMDSSKFVSVGNFNRSKKIAKHKEEIVRNLAQIKKIDISTDVRNLELHRVFLSYCTNVEILHWSDCESVSKEHSDFLFNYLLDPAQNRALYNVTDLKFENIDRKQNSIFFEKMIKLELRNVKYLTLGEISTTYYDAMFKEFCKTYRFLEKYTVRACNENQLIDTCKYMTNLKCLTLYSCAANNLSELLNLKKLEELLIERVDFVVHDDLLVLLGSEHKQLKKLQLNDIDSNILKLLCENCKNCVDLTLDDMHTKDCEPIFRNMVKLKKLSISFSEPAKMNSSRIKSSDQYNITNLTELEHLIVTCFVPGITPELIKKLPKIKNGWEHTWDPADDDFTITGNEDFVINPDTENNEQIESEPVDTSEEIVVFDLADFNWCQELKL